MLRVVPLEPEPRDDPRLDEWAREVVAHLQAVADAYRAIAQNDCFQLAFRTKHEAKADEQDRLIARFVDRHADGGLALVPAPETGPFLYELVPGHGLNSRAVNAMTRAGYRTIEDARLLVNELPDDVQSSDLPPGIGVGIATMVREAIAFWDFDINDDGDDGEIA